MLKLVKASRYVAEINQAIVFHNHIDFNGHFLYVCCDEYLEAKIYYSVANRALARVEESYAHITRVI